MKTEKCRYEVFIGCSRDNQDLRDLADAFASATVECGHFPCPFVLPDVAESEPGLRERIRDADLVVLLSKTNDATLNTQVKALLRDNQPTLKFLIDSPQESASEPPEPSVPGAPVLYRFSSKRGVGELKYQYVIALLDAVRQFDLQDGWIRGKAYQQLMAEWSKTQIMNPFLRRFYDHLNKCAVLNGRCATNAPLKRAIADDFIDFYLERMARAKIFKFFFESGSSIAYLSESFSVRYKDIMKDWPELTIETNNIISYLEFTLFYFANAQLFPSGPPEQKYGATFGDMASKLTPLPPPEKPRLLTDNARKFVHFFADHFRDEYREQGIIFMASSGVELDTKSLFPGPHVGSYYNQVFKRAILESECPIVIFLDETKLPRPFLIKSCFPVCDDALPWAQVCQSAPLAIAAAFWSEEKGNDALRALKELGLTNLELGRSGERPWTVIAGNDRFKERVPG